MFSTQRSRANGPWRIVTVVVLFLRQFWGTLRGRAGAVRDVEWRGRGARRNRPLVECSTSSPLKGLPSSSLRMLSAKRLFARTDASAPASSPNSVQIPGKICAPPLIIEVTLDCLLPGSVYNPSRLGCSFLSPFAPAHRSSSTEASSSTTGTASPSTRRSTALMYVSQLTHSSTRTWRQGSETWCSSRFGSVSPQPGQAVRWNAHSVEQRAQMSKRRPLTSGSSLNTASCGGQPQFGQAAGIDLPLDGCPTVSTAGEPGAVSSGTSASATGCTKARGKNSNADGSQSSSAAKLSSRRRDRNASNSLSAVGVDASSRAAIAESTSVAVPPTS